MKLPIKEKNCLDSCSVWESFWINNTIALWLLEIEKKSFGQTNLRYKKMVYILKKRPKFSKWQILKKWRLCAKERTFLHFCRKKSLEVDFIEVWKETDNGRKFLESLQRVAGRHDVVGDDVGRLAALVPGVVLNLLGFRICRRMWKVLDVVGFDVFDVGVDSGVLRRSDDVTVLKRNNLLHW